MTANGASDDFGSRIKKAREERGLSLRAIATRTKIGLAVLEGLERNDLSLLPNGIFGRGFVRAYAKEVGLDPDQTIKVFLECFPLDSVTIGIPFVPAEEYATVLSERRKTQTAVGLFLFLVPIAIGIIYLTMRSLAPEPDVGPAPAAVGHERPQVADGETSPFATDPLAIELVAVLPVSVMLVVDGDVRTPGRYALAEGARLTLSVERSLSLSVSNAAAVRLTINGQATVPLGSTAQAFTVQIDRDTLASLLTLG